MQRMQYLASFSCRGMADRTWRLPNQHHIEGMPCTQCKVLDVGKYSHPSYLSAVKH